MSPGSVGRRENDGRGHRDTKRRVDRATRPATIVPITARSPSSVGRRENDGSSIRDTKRRVDRATRPATIVPLTAMSPGSVGRRENDRRGHRDTKRRVDRATRPRILVPITAWSPKARTTSASPPGFGRRSCSGPDVLPYPFGRGRVIVHDRFVWVSDFPGRRLATIAMAISAVLIGCACTGNETARTPTPGATPTSSPTVASSQPAFTPLCRLPVDMGNGGTIIPIPTSYNPAQHIGPIDPASRVSLPDGTPRLGLAYDWTAGKWLPVPPAWVSPDGTKYAYVDTAARVHLVGVQDGSDRIVASGALWGIYGVRDDAIYAGRRDPTQLPSLRGLWRILPNGTTTQLATDQTWLVITGDAAWAAEFATPVASGVRQGVTPPAPENAFGDTLTRLDLQTGAQTTWFTSDRLVRVVGADPSGRPVLISVGSMPQQVIWSVRAPGDATSFNTGFVTAVMADKYGIWTEINYGPIITLSQGQ